MKLKRKNTLEHLLAKIKGRLNNEKKRFGQKSKDKESLENNCINYQQLDGPMLQPEILTLLYSPILIKYYHLSDKYTYFISITLLNPSTSLSSNYTNVIILYLLNHFCMKEFYMIFSHSVDLKNSFGNSIVSGKTHI